MTLNPAFRICFWPNHHASADPAALRVAADTREDTSKMGLRVEREQARLRFAEALALANSTEPLPTEWLERTKLIGQGVTKTYTAAFGNALLAKATNPEVDAHSLREGVGHRGYSARGLAKEVLVPCCNAAGIDIRNAGAEPLNNQPFLRADRISEDLNVKPNARAEYERFFAAITAADFLRGEPALHALAAFLRVRIEATSLPSRVPVPDGAPELPALRAALEALVAGKSEGGKVGQAIVAALLGTVFPDTRTRRINDPSRRWAGDVGVYHDGERGIACEVKQHPLAEAEVRLFAKRLAEEGLARGWVVALCDDPFPFDAPALRQEVWTTFGVALRLVGDVSGLLDEVIGYATRPVGDVLAMLPSAVMTRLEQLEVSQSTREQWAQLVGAQLT
jgi:hypothetical protein